MKVNWKIFAKAKQAVIIMVCMMMLMNVMPLQMIEVKAANLDELKKVMINGYEYTTDGHEVMAYRELYDSEKTYDIYGKYNGKWIQTTYSSSGYVPTASSNKVTIIATPKFINEGRYIQMNYTLTASSSITTNFSLASDVMIGSDDYAPITAFQDGSGFKMVASKGSSKDAQFNFYGKNVYGTNPGISTYWFGHYVNRESYRYTQVNTPSLSNTDSAMACSWKNLSVDSKGKTVSMIIGIGEANTAPEVGEIVIPGDSAFVPGKDVTVTVPIENATGDNAKDKLRLYYSLLKPDGTIIDGPNLISNISTNVSGAITNFVATFKIPNYMPSGPFTLRVFAMNAAGGISAEVSKSLTATSQPIKIMSTSGDVSTTVGESKSLSLTLTSSAPPENPLEYQWQKRANGVYSNITGATQSSYVVPVDTVGTFTYRAKVNYKNDAQSSIYSEAMNVTVDKTTSKTTIDSSFDDTLGKMTINATIVAQGGQSVNGDEIKFYNGNTLLGTSTISGGKATLSVAKENLSSGPYTLRAIYAGNNNVYSSTSSTLPLNVNLKMQIIYDQFIQANDSKVIRSYKEGIGAVLSDPAISRDGFAFAGWLSATGELIDRISTTMRGDVNLTSQWRKTSFEVTIDDNLGSASIIQSYDSNKQVSITAPVKTNYTFTKWVCNEASLIAGKENNSALTFVMPEKDVSLVAQYQNSEYPITYKDIDPQANWASSYTYGSKKILPTPSKENAIFVGWHKNSATGEIINEVSASDSGAITLYPAWSQLYQMTIKNNVQGNTQTPMMFSYPQGEEVMVPATTLSGYQFKEWRVVSGGITLDNPTAETLTFDMPNKAVEFEAVYEALAYNITYNLADGTNHESNPATYEFASRIDLKQPTKTGYRFDGWFSDAEFKNAKTAISETDSGDITLYAKWTRNRFSFSLVDASTQDDKTSKEIDYGENVIFHANAKVGYTFKGWQKDENLVIEDLGNGTYQIIMPDKAVTIKAEYEKTRYDISYKNVENIDISDVQQYPKNYVLGYELTLKNPTKEGSEFVGWFRDEVFTTPIEKILATQTGNLNLYAKWSVNSYKIDVDGGKFSDGATSKDAVEYQTSLTLKANEIAGMRFVGWYDSAQSEPISAEATMNYEMPAKNVSLQARFEPIQYNITYNVNPDSIENMTVVNEDENKTSYTYGSDHTFKYPTMVDSDGKAFQTFDGWVIEGSDTKVSTITPTTLGDLNLVAKWVNVTYAITYSGIDGAINDNALNGSQYNTSTSAQEVNLAAPTKIGYEFTGWTTSTPNVTVTDKTKMTLPQGHTGDIALSATWEKQATSYTLNGVAKTAVIDEEVTFDAGTIPSGKEFVNWQVSGNALLSNSSSTSTTFKMDAALIDSITKGTALTITPQLRNATYKIDYEGMDGAINNNPTTYLHSVGATLTSPSKVGYNFKGWKSDTSIQNGVISTEQFGDIKLTATWEAISYNVDVENGNVEKTSPARSSINDASIGDTIKIVADEKGGYKFAGWSLVDGDVQFADSQNASTTFVMRDGDVKVKATYAILPYTISYMDNDEVITTENLPSYTIENDTIELSNAKKDGYDFKGWYTNKEFSGGAVTSIDKGSTGDKTFYAKFEKLHNTITFEQSGLGKYEVKVGGNTQTITDNRYSTQDRGLDVRISVTPADGYSIAKILVNGEEYGIDEDIRFNDFFGNYTIKIIFSGSPSIDTPTSDGQDLNWVNGDGAEEVIDTFTKEDVVIKTNVSADTKVSYQIVKMGSTLQADKWVEYLTDDEIVLNEEGSFIVYIRSEDKDGNTTIIHSKVIAIDKTVPTIKDANGDEVSDEKKIYVDESFQFEDDNIDKVTINGEDVEEIQLTGDQKKTYVIVVLDKAGNKKTITIFADTIESMEALASIKDINENNVKSGDVEAIKHALSTLEDLVATGAQKEKIDKLRDTYQGYIETIEEIEAILAQAKEVADETGWDAQKEADLRDLSEKLDAILAKDHLNTADKESVSENALSLKDKIQMIEIDKEMADLESTTQENVKTKQETVINEILEKVKDAIEQNTQLKDEEVKKDYTEKEEHLSGLKDIIASIVEKIETIKESILNQDLSKPIDSNVLDRLKDIVTELLEGDNIDETEKKYLEDSDRVIEISEKVNDLQKYDPNTVTTKDKEDLQALLDAIEAARKDNSALDDQKSEEIKKVVDTVEDLADIVNDVNQKLDNIKDVIQSDLSKPVEEEKIDGAKKDAQDLLESKNVLPEEKDYVSNSDRVLDILKELEKLKDVSNNEVGVNQEQALKDLLELIKKEKENPVLSGDRWNQLESNTNKIQEYIQTIERVKDATKRIDSLQSYKDSDDLIVLEAYLKAMEDYLASYGKNIGEDQLASLSSNIEFAKEKIKKMRSVNEIYWNDSEVSIKGMNGLSFDKDVTVNVKKIKSELAPTFMDVCLANLQLMKAGYSFDEVYDIDLAYHNEKYLFDGSVEVSIKLTSEQLRLGNLGIVYINEQGEVEVMESRVENGYIIFEATHFSKYAIIYKGSADEGIIKNTSDTATSNIDFGMLILAGILFVGLKKRKTFSLK